MKFLELTNFINDSSRRGKFIGLFLPLLSFFKTSPYFVFSLYLCSVGNIANYLKFL